MKLKWCYLICILALLFYGMAGTAYAQRVYATAQLNSAGSNSSISAATNSIDTDYTNSTLITVPGLIGGASWQQLIFPSTTVPAGSTVFIRLSSGTGLLGGNISYQAYKNATTSVAGTTAVTTTANFTDKNGNSFIAVTSSEAFNAVRITISGGLLATTSANIFYAFYEPPNTNCSTIAGTSTRVTGVALLGSISNPEYAIDESLTTASNFAGGLLGVGSELIQMVYFTNKSNVNDEVSITFSVPPAPLLALGLFNNVTLNVYNGTTLVSTGNVGSLLSLDLLSLLRNGKRQTVSFKPTSTFDRVEVVYATGVGLLNNFKLHEVARTPAKPTTPVAYPSVINACDGETVNISASSASSGAVLKWYKDSIGGTPVRTSTSNSDVFSPTVTYTPGVDTTFYFVTSSWSTGCYAQSQEVKIAVLVHPKPTVPIIPNVITCAGTSATLTVSSPVAGIGYRWYTVASGGTALTTANSYTVANPAATTTYYVEGYNSTTGCVSARTAVTLTVNPLPAAPTIPNVTTCAGTSATLTVGSPVAGIGYRWYTVASGGTALTTANSYTVANPTTTTTYYVEGYNSTTGCVSSRTAVTLTVNPLPAAPTIPNVTTCAGTSATLTVSSPVAGIDYRWYTVASGGTALTTANSYTVTNPTTTTTYYVEGYNTTTGCVSARTAVTLTVNPLPAAPTIPNVTTCAGTSATLTVNSPVAGIGYRWYTVASGGTALTTANSYTVANPTATTTYYVEGYNSTTGCVSARTAVTLTVNALPAAPTIANATTCAGTSATLTVSSPEAGMSYRWYTVASGGTALTTANSYTVANPTTTTTYYVEGYNSTTGCVSARTAVTLTVNALPAAPTIPNVTTCAGTSATLTVNSPEAGISYRWYTVASGGTALTTANNYTVANPTTTTTYYVEGYNSTTGCVSARTAVTLTVNPLPAAPTIPNVTTCAGTSATLTVSSPVAGIDYRWYTVASGGTALTTANSYTVANPTTTTTYYVEGYNSTTGCVSARTAVTLTVNPLPTAPTVPGKATCLGTAATLSVSSPIAGATYRWYTTSTGGSSFFTGTDYTITNPTVTVTYYVEASNASCVSTSRTAVTLTVNPLPVAPTVPNTATCSGTSVLLSVSSPVAGITYRWYSSAGGGTVLNTGPNYIISNPTVTTTYYVEAFNETTGCASSSRTAVTLTINPLPSITLSPSPRICEGDIHASLPYVVANGGNQYKITWDPGTPVSFQNVTSWTNLTGSAITVNVPANASYGVYTGKVSIYNSVNGCEGSLQSFSINIYPAQGKPHLTIQNIVN